MNRKGFLPYCMVIASLLVGCNNETKKEEAVDLKNPLLAKYETNFEVPPFDLIKDEHFRPAFKEALKVHEAEIDSILKIDEPATFANTILALENAGQLLNRVSTVFYNLNSANTNDTIQAIAKDLAPVMSAHRDEINLNPELFKRVKTVYDQRANAGLDAEDQKLLEETYKGFVRSGANLKDEDKEKLKKINAELSVLSTQYGQNLLAETNAFEMVVDKEEDLAGLPKELKAAAAAEANTIGKESKWVFTLQNPSVMPFLQYADNRELRKKIWDAYQLRGNNNNDFDTKEILVKIANLRLDKAKLLGYSSHAAYILEESMAENPANVN